MAHRGHDDPREVTYLDIERLALAAELPASVLADLTGISISTAERWSQWAKRDWTSYIASEPLTSRPRLRQHA